MLKSILLNNPSQICAIIQDDNCVKGTDLFRAVLKHDAENDVVKEIHLISCENPPEYYVESLNNHKVVVHNLFQDPNNWLQKNKVDFDELFERILHSKHASSTVMIDSLNFLNLLINVNYTCNKIHKLKGCFKKVICLFHADETASDDFIKKIRFLSNVYLKLYVNKSRSFMDDKRSKLVEGIHVKPSGKVSTFKEIVVVDQSQHLKSEVYCSAKQNISSSNIKDNFKNITTFRLGLDIKENEKKARDNLVLPYLRSSNKDDVKTGSGEGKIVYYAESEDDLEEDPDDDLDI